MRAGLQRPKGRGRPARPTQACSPSRPPTRPGRRVPYGGCPTAALVPPPPPARLQPPCSGQGAAGHGLCRFLCFARAVGAETCLIFLFPGLSPDQVTGRETPCSVLCHGTRCATTHGPVDQLPPPPQANALLGDGGQGSAACPASGSHPRCSVSETTPSQSGGLRAAESGRRTKSKLRASVAASMVASGATGLQRVEGPSAGGPGRGGQHRRRGVDVAS